MEWFSIFKSGDMGLILNFLEQELYITFFVMLLLMLIQNLFTLIPIIIIIMVNIMLFGFVNGYLWSVATSIVGALSSFLLYRYWFQSLLLKKTNVSFIRKLEQNGFLFVFYLRVIPFVPSSFINTLSGISSIKLSHFLFATILGNSLYLFLLSSIANGLLTEELQDYIILALLIAALPSYYLYRKLKQKFSFLEQKKRWKVGRQ